MIGKLLYFIIFVSFWFLATILIFYFLEPYNYDYSNLACYPLGTAKCPAAGNNLYVTNYIPQMAVLLFSIVFSSILMLIIYKITHIKRKKHNDTD